MLSGYVYEILVTKNAEICTMTHMMEGKVVSKYLLFSHCATDATFQ